MGLWLVWKIGDKEFQIKYQKEIEEWIVYQDQKKFGEMISKIIRCEMDKFHITKDEIAKIIDKMFKKPEFKIIFVEPLKEMLSNR